MSQEDLIDRFAINIKKSELGILDFAKTLFVDRFKYEFGNVHYQIIKVLFKLLDPTRLYSVDKQGYCLVHREAAKTTLATFLLPMYLICMKGRKIYVNARFLDWSDEDIEKNMEYQVEKGIVEVVIDEKFIVIASETGNRAIGFVNNLRSILSSDVNIANIFGEKDPRVIDYIDDDRRRSVKSWRNECFITADGTIVLAQGAQAHTRGLNIMGYRPSLIIADDLYSKRNTKTPDSVLKINQWFGDELVNSLDSRTGKILLLGTLVHPDIIFKDLLVDKQWFGITRQLISNEELSGLLDRYRKDDKVVVPDYETCKEIDTELKTLSWADHKGSYFILSKYAYYYRKNALDSFYKEYMNVAVAPERMMLDYGMFKRTKMEFYTRDNKQLVSIYEQGVEWQGVCNLYVGVDPASSIANKADDTAIVLAGYAKVYPKYQGKANEDYILNSRVIPIIAHIEGGKYSITDYNGMPGMAEALLRIEKRYKIEYINIESAGQQEQIIRQIRKVFYDLSVESSEIRKRATGSPSPRKPRIWSENVNQGMQKSERILSVILPIFQQSGVVYVDDRIPAALVSLLIEQIMTVGLAIHDDYADALSIALKNVVPPEADQMYENAYGQYEFKTVDRWKSLVKKYGRRAWLYN